eukprot:scaffold3033_cov250-Chaetoceros_neogracile.AAC.3
MSSLTYRLTDSFDEAYSDRGTGSNQDLSVWRPNLYNDEYRIIYVATNYHYPGIPTIVVKEKEDSDRKALAKPVHFEVVWTDQNTGGSRDGQIYKAVAPRGYVALSDVATHRDNSSMKPGEVFRANEIDPKFRCVHKSLVELAERDKLVWTDKGSGGRYDGAVWDVSGLAGFKAGRGSGDQPDYQQYSLNHIPGPVYKRLEIVGSFENPHEATKPVKKITKYSVGTSFSSDVSSSISAGISAKIGAKVSGGVTGIATAETSVELAAFLNTEVSVSKKETKNKLKEDTTAYEVDPGTRVTVWQLRVSDSKDGNGGFFDMQCDHTKLVITILPKK